MARNHARVLSESPSTRLDVVVDVDPERAEKLASDFGCQWTTTLGDRNMGAAVVATPPDTHAEIVIALLDRGVPVLVEKPMAPRLADVDAMLATSAQTGTPLMCGFVERFNAAVRTALDLLDEDPNHLVAVRHSPRNLSATASVVADLLVHDMDLAMLFGPTGTDLQVSGSTWTSPTTGLDEIADVVVRFGTQMIATLSASRAGQRKIRSLAVATSRKLFEVDLLRQDLTVYEHIDYPETVGGSYRAKTTIDIPFVRTAGEPLALQLEHFVKLVRGEIDPVIEASTLRPAHAALDLLSSL
jgi:predicted dehydrogenase